MTQADYAKLLAIARDLASKHVRDGVCTFCGSAFNGLELVHNPGCKVIELEAYQAGSKSPALSPARNIEAQPEPRLRNW